MNGRKASGFTRALGQTTKSGIPFPALRAAGDDTLHGLPRRPQGMTPRFLGERELRASAA
jgi:hypothetical protein